MTRSPLILLVSKEHYGDKILCSQFRKLPSKHEETCGENSVTIAKGWSPNYV